jgi:hypothetical protein
MQAKNTGQVVERYLSSQTAQKIRCMGGFVIISFPPNTFNLFLESYFTTVSYGIPIISNYIKKLICIEKNNITDSIKDSKSRPTIILK